MIFTEDEKRYIIVAMNMLIDSAEDAKEFDWTNADELQEEIDLALGIIDKLERS